MKNLTTKQGNAVLTLVQLDVSTAVIILLFLDGNLFSMFPEEGKANISCFFYVTQVLSTILVTPLFMSTE